MLKCRLDFSHSLTFVYSIKNCYQAAMRELGLKPYHRQHKGLNNRAELSHQWTRLREKKMRRFKSAGQAQKILSAAEVIYQHSQPKRHKLSAEITREIMKQKIQECMKCQLS